MRRLYTRRAARRVAERAHKHGVPQEIAHHIAFACRKYHLRYALAFAMFEQESEFEVIYGHDPGGYYQGREVTRGNYRLFRASVVAEVGRGANGVGLGQVTYWTYIRDHRGLWKPKVQVYLATSILADLVHRLGERDGAGSYNGGEANPNLDYADEVLARATKWRERLSK